jgi:SnoaL-like domain
MIAGADKFIEFLAQTLGDAITVHHGHMPKIELTSPTTATGIWALQDTIVWSNGTRLCGYGHYQETYELIDGAWRIKSLKLTRLHMDITGPDPNDRRRNGHAHDVDATPELAS